MNEDKIKELLKDVLWEKDNIIQYREWFAMIIDSIFSCYLDLLKNNPYEAYWSDEADIQDDEKLLSDFNWWDKYKNIFWIESYDTIKSTNEYSFLSRAGIIKGTKAKKKFQNPLGWHYDISKYKVILPNNSYGPYHIMFLTDTNFISLFSKCGKDRDIKYYNTALEYGYKLQKYQNSEKYNEYEDGKYISLLFEKMLGINLVNLIANYMHYIFEELRPCPEGDGYYYNPEFRKDEKEKHRDEMENRIIDFMGSILGKIKDLEIFTKLILVHVGLYNVCFDAKNYAEDEFSKVHMFDMEAVYDDSKTYHTKIYNSLECSFNNVEQWENKKSEVKKLFIGNKIDIELIEDLQNMDELVSVCQNVLSYDEVELLKNNIGLETINLNKPIPIIMIKPPEDEKYKNYAIKLFNINMMRNKSL